MKPAPRGDRQASAAAELFTGRLREDAFLRAARVPAPSPEVASRLAEIERVLRDLVDPDRVDREEAIPPDAIERLAAVGAFGLRIPAEHGGQGFSCVDFARAMELVGGHCASTGVLLAAHQAIGLPEPLLRHGSDDQKARYLPRLAAGEVSAFALTEAGAGSDPARLETRAFPTPDGCGFVLDGEKVWCTNGPLARLFVVLARTPAAGDPAPARPPITAFIVERDTPGVEIGPRSRLLGLRGIATGVLRLRGVRVERDAIIGEEGAGLRLALATLTGGRTSLPAACAGAAQSCLRIAREFARDRHQGGRAIGRHEAVASRLSRIAARVFAMRSVALHAARLVDESSRDVRLEAAMAKVFCSEALFAVADETLQIRGGRGYETSASLAARGEPPVGIERIFRDSRIASIFEGTNDILRLLIAREALRTLHARLGALGEADALRRHALAAVATRLAPMAASVLLPRPRPILLRRSSRDGLGAETTRARRLAGRLARKLLAAHLRHGSGVVEQQALLDGIADAGVRLFATAASLARARVLEDESPDRAHEAAALAREFANDEHRRIDAALRSLPRRSRDDGPLRLAESLLAGRLEWLEDGLTAPPAGSP